MAGRGGPAGRLCLRFRGGPGPGTGLPPRPHGDVRPGQPGSAGASGGQPGRCRGLMRRPGGPIASGHHPHRRRRAARGIRSRGRIARGVLVPEAGPAGSCGWWPYAAYLARRGFHVLAFDHRCQGTSACPASGPAGGPASGSAGGPGQGLLAGLPAAARAWRAAGAGRVALLGASQGGSEALIAAARPARDPGPGAGLAGLGGVAGVAALSADELDQPLAVPPAPRTAVAAAAAVRVPVLLAVAPDDPYVSLAATRALFAALATPAAAKRLLVQPAGTGHGWVMVDAAQGGPGPPLAARLAAFLQTVTA